MKPAMMAGLRGPAARYHLAETVRESLTFLAIVLILVLSAAFAGPYLVDWTAQRPVVEARLGEMLGHRVVLGGPVVVRLLPSPRLELGSISIAETQGAEAFLADAITIELAPMPLLRGELRFVRASFKRPVLHVVLAPDGGLLMPAIRLAIGTGARFENLTLSDATLIIDDQITGSHYNLTNLALEAEAASLEGPFKGSGQMMRPSGPVAFRFSTGSIEDGRLRFKAIVDEAVSLPRIEVEAALIMGQGANPASIEGSANLSGVTGDLAQLPWRLSGAFQGDFHHLRASALEFKLGAEGKALVANGQGDLQIGPKPVASLRLSARQLDLDRFDPTPGHTIIAAALAALHHLVDDPDVAKRPPITVGLDVSCPALTLAGETLTDVSLSAFLVPDQPIRLHVAGQGPGSSSLNLNGVLEQGSAPIYRGALRASTRDASRLGDWLLPLLPGAGAALRAAPVRSLEIAGDVEVSDVSFAGRNLDLRMDRSALSGAITYTSAVWNEPPRLFADLSSPALDLDSAPDLTSVWSASAKLDISLALDARAVKVTRFGEGMIDAGHIVGKLTKTGKIIRLDHFTIDNLGGANVAMSGEWSGASGHLDGSVNADRLVDLAALARRIAPGAAADAFARRAVALSPARLTLASAGALLPGDAGLGLTRLTLMGTAGSTRINASFEPDAGSTAAIVGNMFLDAPEAGALLRQLGLDALQLTGRGPGHIAASLRGNFRLPLMASVDATLAGAQLHYDGTWLASLTKPQFKGAFKLESANLTPLTQVLALALPDSAARLPARLVGQVEGTAAQVTLSGLAGTIAGTKLAGGLTLRQLGDKASISGTLHLDQLWLPALTALAFGQTQPPRGGAVWSDLKFARALVAPPQTLLELSADTVALGDFGSKNALSAQHAKWTLGLAPGELRLVGLAAQFGDGHVSGDVTVRRDGSNASVAGKLAFERIAVDLPSLAAEASGTIDLTATGASASQLAGALAGDGQISLRGIAVPRADGGTIAAILARADQGQLTVEEGEMQRTLSRALDRGRFTIAAQDFSTTMAAGTLRLVPKPPSDALKLSLDLRSLLLDQRLTQTIMQRPKDWMGPLPSLDVVFKGPVMAPKRDVEAGNFINGLAAREIARDTARIAALDADIRERAAFNRRLKADRQSRQNEIDLANFLKEQAAREAKAAEDARRAATLENARRALEQLRAKPLESQMPPVQLTPDAVPTPGTSLSLPPAIGDPSSLGPY